MNSKIEKFQRGYKASDKLWNRVCELSKKVAGYTETDRVRRRGNGQFFIDRAIAFYIFHNFDEDPARCFDGEITMKMVEEKI